jgi:gas vesicle protein GvpA/GvpJ/GvpM family
MALDPSGGRLPQTYGRSDLRPQSPGPANLADILERVLDKGIVIAGDIQINLLDIELLTIKIRLLVASVDRAREMGINWWESDPTLSVDPDGDEDKRSLRERVDRLERMLGSGDAETQTQTETQPESQTKTRSRGGNAKRR